MDKKLVVFLSLIIGLIIFSVKNTEKSHQLLTREEADAFELFNSWMKDHARQYR